MSTQSLLTTIEWSLATAFSLGVALVLALGVTAAHRTMTADVAIDGNASAPAVEVAMAH